MAIRDPIRTRSPLSANIDDLRLIDRQRQTGLPGKDRREFPTSEGEIGSPGPIPPEYLLAPKGQLPNARRDEPVREIELRGSILHPTIMRILRLLVFAYIDTV